MDQGDGRVTTECPKYPVGDWVTRVTIVTPGHTHTPARVTLYGGREIFFFLLDICASVPGGVTMRHPVTPVT